MASRVREKAKLLLPKGYLCGLTLSTAGASTSFGIAIGEAVDNTGVALMRLGSAFTKTNGAWTLGGTGAGSLDTGTIAANTWYHVWLIERPDTGVVDVVVSLSATAPTLPTNYTLARRIGSLKTDPAATTWRAFTQVGDEFLWKLATQSSAANTVAGQVPLTLDVPTGVRVFAKFAGSLNYVSGPNALLFYALDQGTQVVNAPVGYYNAYAAAAGMVTSFDYTFRTNTSAQIGSHQAAGGGLYMATYGWIDRRGRDDS